AIAPGPWQLVDNALLVDLLEGFEGERRARAVTQQLLVVSQIIPPAISHCVSERRQYEFPH
ncbi:MAG: hypothetical protein P8Y27_15200, partial [Chromatiaceae bacterium]